jgi:hypothetical protein
VVGNGCAYSNDILDASVTVPEAAVAATYQDFGGGPYPASVYKPASVDRPWISLVDGWDLEHFFGGPAAPSVGRLEYFMDVLNQAFGAICFLAGTPVVPLDVPGDGGKAVADYMKLLNNPLRFGAATVRFGLARPDRVEARVYDVSGRLVRTLAARAFPAGEHTLTWDGLDEARRPVPHGVYFARLHYQASGFADAKKVIVLR